MREDAAGEAGGAGGGGVRMRGRGSLIDVNDMVTFDEQKIQKLPHERSLLEREVEHLFKL